MTIEHHPSDETLARVAAGRLDAAPAIVVAVHLAACPDCRAKLRGFEAIGGALLEDLAPAEMSADALASVLGRLDEAGPAEAPPRPTPRVPRFVDGIELPAALDACEVGPLRRYAPGFRMSRIRMPGDPKANLMLMRIGAGRKMPEHGHTGIEYTLVLRGSFSDGIGHYHAGDLAEADATTDHQPVVDVDGECICLAAIEGRMKLSGILGRLLQPLLGF